MAETFTYTSPITKPSQTSAALTRVTLDFENQSVLMEWCADTGEMANVFYTTPPSGNSPSGAKLLAQIVNGDFAASGSLVRWLLTVLQTDACLPAGTIEGQPEKLADVEAAEAATLAAVKE